MPTLADYLRRFRYGGVPGAPASIGVPPDRRAELEAELVPVLALLDEPDRQASSIVARAERRAIERQADAEVEAAQVLAEAERRAERVRAAASATRQARTDRECDALLATARDEASRIEVQAAEKVPSLARRVVEQLLGGEALGPRPPMTEERPT